MNDNKILGHEYDGIEELDNPLPLWWLVIFIVTIYFAIFYYVHYTFMGGPSHEEQLKTAMEEILKNKSQVTVNANEGDLEKKSQSPESLASGKGIYATRCASCHREDGGGIVGPNLTDSFWIHGQGNGADIFQAVANGVLDKGMPAWKEMLKPSELSDVVAYVLSLRGKNVKGKEPQGTEIK